MQSTPLNNNQRRKRLPFLPKGMNNRWWQFRIIDLITSIKRSRKSKKGLVVIRMDGLGDMILFRQSLDYYCEAFSLTPEDITILGCNSWRTLSDTIFKEYNVVTINEHAYERKFSYRLKISLWLAKQAFQTAVCDIYFRKTMTCDSLLYYSYADRIAVCEPYPSKKTKPRFDYYRHIYTDIIDTGPHPMHETLRHYNFVSGLLKKQIKPKPLHIKWRNNNNPIQQKPYVAFNFGSNEAGRRWPFENFIELAKRVIERGYYAVFLGGPAELHYIDILNNTYKHPRLINYIGKDKGLTEVLDIFQHAHATITSETGPGHFSFALQKPTLMICGGGAYTLFVPYPKEISTENMRFAYAQRECFGCLEHCPYRQDANLPFPCLADVTIEQAWQAFEDLIPSKIPETA
jgi:ADP-heptose:LPS heptosyltransferase